MAKAKVSKVDEIIRATKPGKPGQEAVTISLPPLTIHEMEIDLVGDSPLISHAWSEKAKREMLEKQMKKAKQAKAKDCIVRASLIPKDESSEVQSAKETSEGRMSTFERYETFRKDLEAVINKHSMEGGSDTPDFILARYLTDCLGAYDLALRERTRWHEGVRVVAAGRGEAGQANSIVGRE